MATQDGDLVSVKILSRTLLPGGGVTTTGKKVQNKVLVTGEITVQWVSTGIDFSTATGAAPGGDFKLLGCDVLDFVEFSLRSTDGAAPANDKLYMFALNRSTSVLYGFEDVGAGQSLPPSDGDVLKLSYIAVGDNHDADLT
jgi:hypothetical protein